MLSFLLQPPYDALHPPFCVFRSLCLLQRPPSLSAIAGRSLAHFAGALAGTAEKGKERKRRRLVPHVSPRLPTSSFSALHLGRRATPTAFVRRAFLGRSFPLCTLPISFRKGNAEMECLSSPGIVPLLFSRFPRPLPDPAVRSLSDVDRRFLPLCFRFRFPYCCFLIDLFF